MRQSKAVVAVIAVLIAAMSVPAFARGQSGGGGSHRSGATHAAGHPGSGVSHVGRPSGTVGFGHTGAHPYTGVRPHAAPHGHPVHPPPRHYGGGARVGVVIGAPLLFAPLMYPAPAYYYSPPPTYFEQEPTYVEPAPAPAYWYFCPQLNAYYPYVQECPRRVAGGPAAAAQLGYEFKRFARRRPQRSRLNGMFWYEYMYHSPG